MVFILTEKSAASEICAWEVEEARRLGKRILPVTIGSIVGVTPPAALGDLNWIPFYAEPAIPGSGFYYGVKRLEEALSVDLDWLRAQTRYSERAQEWSKARPEDLLLRGEALKEAEAWLARTPSGAHPPDLVREYLAAGGNAEQHRQAAAKAQREEREQALKTAEAAVTARQEAIAEGQDRPAVAHSCGDGAGSGSAWLVASALWGCGMRARSPPKPVSGERTCLRETSSQLLREGNRPLAMLIERGGRSGRKRGVVSGLFRRDGYPALRAALVRAHANDLLVQSVVLASQTAFASLRDGRSFVVASAPGGTSNLYIKGQLQTGTRGAAEPRVTIETEEVAEAIIALSTETGCWSSGTTGRRGSGASAERRR